MHKNVLLVDDDVVLVEMLKEYLEREGFAVVVVHDGRAGVWEALNHQYHIVVLDVMMPGIGGIEALQQIRRGNSNIPILMLTAKGDDADRITGLELGADDYVSKPCTPRELVARIRAILRRNHHEILQDISVASTVSINAGLLTLWPEQRKAVWKGNTLELTSTEFNLLQILARNVGNIVSKVELSENGLNRPLLRFDRVIDVHMSSIRHKLGSMSDGRPYIQAVHRKGYQFIKE